MDACDYRVRRGRRRSAEQIGRFRTHRRSYARNRGRRGGTVIGAELPIPFAFVLGVAMVAISVRCWSTRESYRDRFFFWPMGPMFDPASKWGRFHWYWNVWGTILFFGVLGVLTVVGSTVRFVMWVT